TYRTTSSEPRLVPNVPRATIALEFMRTTRSFFSPSLAPNRHNRSHVSSGIIADTCQSPYTLLFWLSYSLHTPARDIREHEAVYSVLSPQRALAVRKGQALWAYTFACHNPKHSNRSA